jgi:hypothetical protein
MLTIATSPYHHGHHHLPIRQHQHSPSSSADHHHHNRRHYNPLPSPSTSPSNSCSSPLVSSMEPGEGGSSTSPTKNMCQTAVDPVSLAAVAEALEIARESPDGEQDPTIRKILDDELARIWAKVEAQPTSYVMTREEFGVFNFFQHRFKNNEKAIAARRRYWDNARPATP